MRSTDYLKREKAKINERNLGYLLNLTESVNAEG